IITVEMKSMTAWQVRAWGEPESMSLAADAPIPEPGPGQIRIANRAMAANFFDILQIQGKYQVKPPFPFTPGAEVAGIVDAVGSGVTAVRAGDRVMAAPIATAGGAAKTEFCQAQGADYAIDYSGGGWVERVKELTGGRGADVICDPVGGDVFDLSTKCLALEGRLLVVGFASGRIPAIQANR